MMMKALVPLICLGVLMTAAGCTGHHPHGRMPMREAPEVTPDHFRVYEAGGRASSIDEVVRAAVTADVVFIGEEHDDPVAHYLEHDLLRRIFEACGPKDDTKTARRVVLSMEMFERDVQTVVDEYMADLITERHFRKAARPWPAYRTDYRPMVEFAKAGGIPVVAANAPGRYVNRVARLGRASLADLPPASKAWLPPLPYGEASTPYRERFEKFWAATQKDGVPHGPAEEHPADDGPASPEARQEASESMERLLDAQSLWDAAMAWNLAESLERYPGALAVHVNGKFHSEFALGIPEHLARYRPDLYSLTVTIRSVDAFPAFDPAAAGAGAFVIITDPSLKH